MSVQCLIGLKRLALVYDGVKEVASFRKYSSSFEFLGLVGFIYLRRNVSNLVFGSLV